MESVQKMKSDVVVGIKKTRNKRKLEMLLRKGSKLVISTQGAKKREIYKVILEKKDKLDYKFLEENFPKGFSKEVQKILLKTFSTVSFILKLKYITENREIYCKEIKERGALEKERKKELKNILEKEAWKLPEEKMKSSLLAIKKKIIMKYKEGDEVWKKREKEIEAKNSAGEAYINVLLKYCIEKEAMIDFFLLFKEKFPKLKNYVLSLYKNLVKTNSYKAEILTSFIPKISKVFPLFGYLNRGIGRVIRNRKYCLNENENISWCNLTISFFV